MSTYSARTREGDNALFSWRQLMSATDSKINSEQSVRCGRELAQMFVIKSSHATQNGTRMGNFCTASSTLAQTAQLSNPIATGEHKY